MDLNKYIHNWSRLVARRFSRDDRYEMIRDLEQEGHLALAKCPSHYVDAQRKVAIRYTIMQAMVRWRWQVTYHGKRYVKRDDPQPWPDKEQDCWMSELGNPEAILIALENPRVHGLRSHPDNGI